MNVQELEFRAIFSYYPVFAGGIGEAFTNGGVPEDVIAKVGAGAAPPPAPS